MEENENPQKTPEWQPDETNPFREEPAQESAQPAPQPDETKPFAEFAQESAQPARPQFNTAAAEQQALFTTGSGVWMLIACIVATVGLCGTLLGKILSFDYSGVVPLILDIVIIAGLWVTFSLCKKKTLSPKGIKLIKIPYIIIFVLTAIGFGFEVLSSFLLMAISYNPSVIFLLLLCIASFVFEVLCFKTIKQILDMAIKINTEQTTAGLKAGKLAAIALIISSAITFIIALISSPTSALSTLEALAELPYFGEVIGDIVATLRELMHMLAIPARVFSILAACVTLFANVSIAIVLLQFSNKMKKVREAASAAYSGQ